MSGSRLRNRFVGLVTRVVRDTVMAQVEIQAGPHRFVSLMSREAADELGLEPGVLAVAAVKATNVVVEVPEQPCMMRAVRTTAVASRRWPVAALLAALSAAPRRGGSALAPAPASSSATPAVAGTITVFAAASLTGAFTTLGKQFEAAHPGVKVTFSFGASSGAGQQINQGAPADVFASASRRTWTGRRRRRRVQPEELRQERHGDRRPAGQPGARSPRSNDLAKSSRQGGAVPAAGAVRRDRREGLHERRDHRQAGDRRRPT